MTAKANEKKALQSRWKSRDFVSKVIDSLKEIKKFGKNSCPLDLRGGVFGDPSQPHKALYEMVLASTQLCDVQFDYSKITCNFAAATLKDVSFKCCRIDDCHFSKAVVSDCDFSGSTIYITVKDGKFLRCNFENAIIKSTFSRGSWRRNLYEECNFNGVQFKGIEDRASRYVNCSFKGAKWFMSELVHCKFTGPAPASEQFEQVDMEKVAREMFPSIYEEIEGEGN